MEAVILVGTSGGGEVELLQAAVYRYPYPPESGHAAHARRREGILLRACLEAKQPVVIDNTNPRREDRARYIGPAKAAGFKVVGYFFDVALEECKQRNAGRTGKGVVPVGGLWHEARLVWPTLEEGFDEIWRVRCGAGGDWMLERVG